MMRRVAFVAIVVVLTSPALTTRADQRGSAEPVGPFRTIRGRTVADDASDVPLRKVRIVLTGNNIVSSPTYTDEQGRFEIVVPGSAPYVLTFTKAGFAPLEVQRATPADVSDLQERLFRGAAVTGRVVDQFGDPLFARVRVRRVADGSGRPVTAAESIADADDLGEFRAGSLPAGRYEVRVDPINPPAPPGAGAGTSVTSRDPVVVQVRAGEEVTLNLVEETHPMDPRGIVIGASRAPIVKNGGVIRGLVVGPDGRSVGGAFITLRAGVEGARETATDAEGRYEFAGLPAGTYRINAVKRATSLGVADRNREVTIGERQIRDSINIRMERASAVIGSVVDEYGDPLEGVTVELWRSRRVGGRNVLQRNPGGVLPRRTDDRGRYRLFGVSPGDYFVAAGEEPRVTRGIAEGSDNSLRVYYPGTPVIAEAVPLKVLPGQDTLGVHIGYASPIGARVYGSAFDATGQPLKFPVTLMESSRSGVPMLAQRTALVSEDGTFAFLNVPPGEYVIQGVVRPSPGRSSEFGVAFVSVGAPDAPPVTLRTSRGTTVRGRVVLEGDTSNVRFDSFGVGASPSDVDYNPIGLDISGAGVRDDGTFELRLQGPMRITSTVAPQKWWLKSATVGAADVADQPYAFSGSEPVEVTVVFSDATAEISGRVVGDRGQAARDYWVLVFPTDSARWHIASRHIKLGRPNAEGAFHIVGLPPGDYWVVAVDRFEVAQEWQDSELLALLVRSALGITLSERQRIVRELPLVRR
jgi:Carboxypeptidase regulatory-like domain